MSFITDKQTTDELNLLGRYQPDSIFGLFNNTHTRGGERLLEKLLKSPLTNATLINQRTAIFQYFQKKNYSFSLNREQIGIVANWLDSGGNKTYAGSLFSTLRKKTLSSLVHDEQYAAQIAGLSAAAQVLQQLFIFLSGIVIIENHFYEEKIKSIKKILADKNIEKLRSLATPKKLSVKDVAFYDRLLKYTMINEINKILEFIYELDVNITVSDVARQKRFAYAEAKSDFGNEIKIKGLKHPALNNAVGNDLCLDDKHNLLFLTGANMAGKSTLIKSVGIALYMAHCGFPVAVEEMVFTAKDGLFSSINVPDNISLGYSHFYAEVLRVKRAAELVSQGRRVLVMFDELFKGTNVKDAYEGTLEVTKAFSKYTDCLFIISTHIIEVGEALKSSGNIKFGYMPTIMESNKPCYSYLLTEGITEDKQGMLIIKNEGVVELLNKNIYIDSIK
ncbi:hypothetical protein A9P82_02025 [Arachidicoccus ginsenosidimutans]|uniref:MutS-related protein n=1 Tax=Arachidicoccus sp. BS20 TaxID=1850526 RepID=UPI0007F087A5|nr:hypothetical protein [Arachidicoccus sp. BS20]ANI88192.1 hypothetical protein A9P82_02025 [Arachidicoccus sp. BS20]